MASQPSLAFTVTRQKPELVAPAEPTPREIKYLSNIDDQQGLRFQVPFIHFYRNEPSMSGKDPVQVIRQALAKALVFFYPFAGRLREGPGRKLMVDCTGEGVMFIEADADATLQHFAVGGELKPPFPCFDQLLYNVPGSAEILNCPLFLIQVTRLRCGGFIFALRLNHSMSDACGLVHFLNTIAEIARGAEAPSVYPVWQREFFDARNPPRITCTHYEFEEVPADSTGANIPLDNLVHRSFFFGPTEISALRSSLPPHLLKCSRFEVVTACLWRCRTIAMEFDPNDEVRIFGTVNARPRLKNPPVPNGYYGNAFVYPGAKSTAGKVSKSPLSHALELVTNIKSSFTEEYIKSVADLMILKGRPTFTLQGTFIVSDVTRVGFPEIDMGWGQSVFGGPAHGGVGGIPGLITFYIPYEDNKGDHGILVPMCLPAIAMGKFVKELENCLMK
ncbi:PREDICTED: benzyl alcohol O-benzoyltransferase-like isoform X2 [Ipomoea nil]|nr:PREDICTED: benzyl alcohol O-benzoyltransferase-like isoform X2 [Ipomoea nil]